MTIAETGLQNLSGIGSKIAEKLIEYFGGEEQAMEAIMNSTISEIASIRGISMKKAMQIVSTFHEKKMGVKKDDILKTNDIKKIHDEIISILKSYAMTDYIRDKFSILYPLPSNFRNEIEKRIQYFAQARNVVEKTENLEKKIKLHLSKIRPLRNSIKKIRRKKAILVDDEGVYEKILKDEDLIRYCDVRLVNSNSPDLLEILHDCSQSYDLVFTCFENCNLETDFINVISLHEVNFKEILPEFGIDIFVSNSKMIKHSYILVKIIHSINDVDSDALARFKKELNLEILDEIIEFLDNIVEDGEISPDFNDEIRILRESIDEFDDKLNDLELWINETITKRIEEMEVRLDGNQILNILKARGENSDGSFNLVEFLPSDIAEIIMNTIQEAEEILFEKLHLQDLDEISINSLFIEDDLSLPIEFNQEKLQELKQYLSKKYYVKEHFILLGYQEKISRYEKDLRKIIKVLLDVDEFFAVGYFARDYNLRAPILKSSSHGIAFKSGINLFLKQEELNNPLFKIDPVDYCLGKNDLFPGKTKNEKIIVLSGANSGGKTCLLQTIAQIVLLAQMGLPVPAQIAEVGLQDEIYYFSKSAGMVSAGAFETSLKTFSQIALTEKTALVLFDELEAMTEPGAATKIISCLLEIFHDMANITCCLVSHLAEQIMKNINAPVRIDGIEARGLQDGTLIVDRTPRYYYLAKSMPILIVEKLCNTNDARRRKFYTNIKEYLQK
ncbi:MAG: MutS-related protein [Candidatus Helarchaeales archaeon]